MIKIYFLEKSIPFNANDLNSHIIAGTEKTLINISNELSKNKNLIIKVFNQNKNFVKINNVEWHNLTDYKNHDQPDILIAFSDANLFNNYVSKKKYLWSHSVQNIEKFIRKKQLIPFFKHKPIMILESKYHYNTRNIFTSLYGKKIIDLAADYEFINESLNVNFVPKKKAIFTTRPDRNIDFLLSSWMKINQKSLGSELYINPPYKLTENQINIGIKLRVKSDKSQLIDDLKNSRVMLNPGHKGEVFCLAAIEAQEMCLPIVTMGYGSLSERIEHGKTGYIAKNKSEFINYSIDILNNDETYLKFKNNLFNNRGKRTYKNVADDLLKIIIYND
tara:strand:- start:231 stop:1229 length:999 start_codon:yes stop_codon:yes gene_type:complete